VLAPSAQLSKKLESELQILRQDIEGLEKRLTYLETTQKNSRDHINRMLSQVPGN